MADTKEEGEEREVLTAKTPVEDDTEDFAIEIEDDTPKDDKGKEPMPKEIVKELDGDELEEYSANVKQKMKQLKKVWHDERREKERVQREQREALDYAKRVYEENQRLRNLTSAGERALIESRTQGAATSLESAKQEYQQAYEAGDAAKMAEAQQKIADASFTLNQVKSYQPTLQNTPTQVQASPQPQQAPTIDAKTRAWQERNTWWNNDVEMTSAALGLHQKLAQERGPQFVGTDEYWTAIDETMAKRFPDRFDTEEDDDDAAVSTPKPRKKAKSDNVVAPASRSTAPKKVVLKQSQLAIARKLGLTPEQYAKELIKLEQNQ